MNQAGFSQRPALCQLPPPRTPYLYPCPVLTAVQLITAILAVLLPITDIVFGDAVPAVACGLMGSTGHRPVRTGEQMLGSQGAW